MPVSCGATVTGKRTPAHRVSHTEYSPAAHKAYFGQHRVGELARRGSLDPHVSFAGACQILARDPAVIVWTTSAIQHPSDSSSQSRRHIHDPTRQTRQNAMAQGIDCSHSQKHCVYSRYLLFHKQKKTARPKSRKWDN